MITLAELSIFLVAASLPATYVLLMRHFITKNEIEDLAKLARSGPLEAHECCCETAAKALAGSAEKAREMAAA